MLFDAGTARAARRCPKVDNYKFSQIRCCQFTDNVRTFSCRKFLWLVPLYGINLTVHTFGFCYQEWVVQISLQCVQQGKSLLLVLKCFGQERIGTCQDKFADYREGHSCCVLQYLLFFPPAFCIFLHPIVRPIFYLPACREKRVHKFNAVDKGGEVVATDAADIIQRHCFQEVIIVRGFLYFQYRVGRIFTGIHVSHQDKLQEPGAVIYHHIVLQHLHRFGL